MSKFLVSPHIGKAGNIGCSEPCDIMLYAKFPNLYGKGMTFNTMACSHVIYDSNSCSVVNHQFNMLPRKRRLKRF